VILDEQPGLHSTGILYGRHWEKSKNVACMLDIESKVVTVYQYPEVILGKINL
jgi:hypothetical protein